MKAGTTRSTRAGVLMVAGVPSSTSTVGSALDGLRERHRAPLDSRDELLSDRLAEGPQGELELDLVGNDVVLRAAVDRADGHDGRLGGSISRLTIVCRSTIKSAARTIGSTVRCGQAPWPPLPRTMTLTEVELAMRRPRAVTDRADGFVGPAVQGQGEVGLGEPGIKAVVEHRPGAADRLLGGLADQDDRAGPAVRCAPPATGPCR